ncbi:MAG: hypothetical protein JXR72_08405 [Proteobacteria bacterium]|nr:hypothetical protein [Pseudomonadota bacterium]
MEYRSGDRRTLTACHEAGHAVVAYDQGIRVFGISVVPGLGKRGHTCVDTLFLDRQFPSFSSDKGARNRFTLERHVMVLLGGRAAVERLDPEAAFGREGCPVPGSDHIKALDLILRFTGDPLEAEKYLEWLKVRTKGIVSKPVRWFQIEELAEVLLKEDKLGARKVMEILREREALWCRKHGEQVQERPQRRG